MNRKLIYYIYGIAALFILGSIILFSFTKIITLNSPKISVVMSTYNRSNSLSKAIDSILNQSFPDFEFIIINDGSTDNTAAILRKYEAQDSRIKVLTNSLNRGLIYSLNRGIDAAKGKYIARMDDDDVSLIKRFEKQYQFMEENPDITLTSSFVANPHNNRIWPFQQQLNSEYMRVELYTNTVPISHPSIFLRRSFLNDNKIRYNEKYPAAEDRKFYLDLFDAGAKMGKIPEVLVLYRRHHSNSKKYYNNQRMSGNAFMQDEILPRFNIKTIYDENSYCSILAEIVEANKTKKILTQEVLEDLVKKKCP